ncbi:MAG: formyl-CoA transferase, partial [Chloroflexota bacterium]
DITHDELGDTIRYPSGFIKPSEISWEVRSRAPLVGEHNEQLYITEMGITRNELERLKREGTI